MLRGDEKILLTTFAAREIGKEKIEYAVQHCLIFYLIEEGFKFPAYNFIPATLPQYSTTGLLSRELEHDIDRLVGRGVLKLTASPFVFITEPGIEEAKPLVDRLEEEGEQYEKLKSVIKDAVESDWHIFLQRCYTMYIRKEYRVATG